MKKLFNSFLSLFGNRQNTEIKKIPFTVIPNPTTERTLIKINDYEYLVDNSFQKEGAYPNTCDKNSVFGYLASNHLIKAFKVEFIDWLKNDVGVKDHPVSYENLFNFIRKFRALNGDDPIGVASIHSEDLLLVIVIERNSSPETRRGLNHVTSLISAICKAEDMQYDGHALFSHYRITENEKVVSRDFRKGEESLYCFALKYE